MIKFNNSTKLLYYIKNYFYFKFLPKHDFDGFKFPFFIAILFSIFLFTYFVLIYLEQNNIYGKSIEYILSYFEEPTCIKQNISNIPLFNNEYYFMKHCTFRDSLIWFSIFLVAIFGLWIYRWKSRKYLINVFDVYEIINEEDKKYINLRSWITFFILLGIFYFQFFISWYSEPDKFNPKLNFGFSGLFIILFVIPTGTRILTEIFSSFFIIRIMLKDDRHKSKWNVLDDDLMGGNEPLSKLLFTSYQILFGILIFALLLYSRLRFVVFGVDILIVIFLMILPIYFSFRYFKYNKEKFKKKNPNSFICYKKDSNSIKRYKSDEITQDDCIPLNEWLYSKMHNYIVTKDQIVVEIFLLLPVIIDIIINYTKNGIW